MPKGVFVRNPKFRYGPLPSISPEQDQEIKELYLSGLSRDAVAEKMGLSLCVVRKSFRRTKTPMRGKANVGEKNGSWKGGRRIDEDGYVLIRMNRRYVREHRFVAEQSLGRPLDSKEVVHHKNGDKQDNRPENLIVFPDNATHLAIELAGRVPNWTEDGFRRMLEGQKGKKTAKDTRVNRTGRAGALRSRKKQIAQFLHDTSGLGDIAEAASLLTLQPLPDRSPIQHEKE